MALPTATSLGLEMLRIGRVIGLPTGVESVILVVERGCRRERNEWILRWVEIGKCGRASVAARNMEDEMLSWEDWLVPWD